MNSSGRMFPNIPIHPAQAAVGHRVQQALDTRPDLHAEWQGKVAHLMPEFVSILQKRNDHPDTITPEDIRRITVINEEIFGALRLILEREGL